MSNQSIDATGAVPAVTGRVELRGVDFVPPEERHSKPSNLTWVWVGAQMTFGIVILGWLPITLGLSWWASVTSITLGLATGAVLFGLFSLFGPRTGTNSAVSSGAHFGVRGRLIASVLAVFIAVGYAALTVWVTGDMVASGVVALFGGDLGDGSRAVAYLVVTAAMIVIALFGHNLVVTMQKIVTPLVIAALLLIVFLTLGDFDPSFGEGAESAVLGFWPTWFFSFFVAAQLPISYTPFANQFSRYVPDKPSGRPVFWAAAIGMFVGCWIALIFGAYIATLFSTDVVSFGEGVVAAVPTWFIVPLLLISLLGSFGQGGLALYGSGLDASAIVPKLRRFPATVILSIISLGLVFLGAFVWNVIDAVSAFVVILAVMVVPWLVICLIGYARAKGRYWPADLQTFETGVRGGAYWFTNGFDIRAIAVYIIGVVSSLLFVSTTMFTGPFIDYVGGVDISIVVGGVVTLILYPLALRIFPEKHPVAPPAVGDRSVASPALRTITQ